MTGHIEINSPKCIRFMVIYNENIFSATGYNCYNGYHVKNAKQMQILEILDDNKSSENTQVPLFSCVGVTYKTDFRLDDWIYCTLYIHTTRDYRQYSAIADLHTLEFTITHAVGFCIFTSHILATDLQSSHCYFRSHMKSPLHRLLPLLPFLLNQLRLPSSELDPILFGVPKLDSSLSATVLYSSSDLLFPFTIHCHAHHGKHHLLLLRRCVYSSVA
jgi:hypothetical protein